MKINYLAIILLVFSCKPAYAGGFDTYVWLPASLEQSLSEICRSTNNLAINELILAKLAVSYNRLLAMPLAEKEGLVSQFRSKYCINRSTALNSNPRYDVYIDKITNLLSFLPSLERVLSDRNLTAIEYVLNCFGVPYDRLINLDFSFKLGILSDLLAPNLASGPMLSAKSVSLPVVAPAVPAAPAAGGAGAPVVAPVAPVVGAPAESFITNTKTACDDFMPELGAGGFCLFGSTDLNTARLLEFPVIGKYASPYNFASARVVIKNNLVARGRDSILENIKNVIPVEYEIDFYTEILYWANQEAGYKLFHDKDNIFNILFHGTMMNWFATTYQKFNFEIDNVSQSFPMGVAGLNGITSVDLGNLDAGQGLKLLDVNPHEFRYSPDNANFRVLPDRNLVTFWSVAKSEEMRKAIVTYHVLVNADMYRDLETGLDNVASKSNTISELIIGLRALPVVAGADGAAWQGAIDFLSRLYSVR